jgi:hypothetical protein
MAAKAPAFRVRGTYFESCNCDPICPCRMVGGVPGGRSTHGICTGVLSWRIEEGRCGDTNLDGLNAVLVIRYDDDEPGSPWSVALHVDARGDDAQRQALEHVFLDGITNLPWIRKQRHVVGVRVSEIELGGTHIHVGDAVTVDATRPVETELPVACGIPGYDRVGYELHADELRVEDGPFRWELHDVCAFTSDFDYRSA